MKPETFHARLNALSDWNKEQYVLRRAKAIMASSDPSKELSWFVKEIPYSMVWRTAQELFVSGAPISYIDHLVDRWYGSKSPNRGYPGTDLVLALYRSRRKEDPSVWSAWMKKAQSRWGDPVLGPTAPDDARVLSSSFLSSARHAVMHEEWDMIRLMLNHFCISSSQVPKLCIGTPVFKEVMSHVRSLKDVLDVGQQMISKEVLETEENQEEFALVLKMCRRFGGKESLKDLYIYAQARNTLVYAGMIEKIHSIDPKEHQKMFESMLLEGNVRAFEAHPNLKLNTEEFKSVLKKVLRHDITQSPSKYTPEFVELLHRRHKSCAYYASAIAEVLNTTIVRPLNRKTATTEHLKYMLDQVDDETKSNLLKISCEKGRLELPRVLLYHFPHIDPHVPTLHWRIKEDYQKLLDRADRKALKKTVQKQIKSPSAPSIKRKM